MKKFDNYRKNLDVLRRSDQQDLNNEFIISGIIDKFSIQFELGWKVLKSGKGQFPLCPFDVSGGGAWKHRQDAPVHL